MTADYEVQPYQPERPGRPAHHSGEAHVTRVVPRERIALVDLLDRVLAGGVVVAGEITLSVADVDMVTVSLRALVTSVSALAESGADVRELAQ
jgi:Gas vesicle protein